MGTKIGQKRKRSILGCPRNPSVGANPKSILRQHRGEEQGASLRRHGQQLLPVSRAGHTIHAGLASPPSFILANPTLGDVSFDFSRRGSSAILE